MEWLKVCAASALDLDEVVKVASPCGAIAVYRLAEGYYASQDACPHGETASMSDGFVEDGLIECPLHGAKFCIRTGALKGLPATSPLRTYPVKVEGGEVFVGLAGIAAAGRDAA